MPANLPCRARPPDGGRGARAGLGRAPARVRYDGSTTISSKVLPLALPEPRRRTGVEVEVGRGGSGRGLEAMFSGEADLAGVARALSAEERAGRPFVAILGYDGLGVFVNESNPVRALSREQVKALFTGTARTWRPVGGRHLPVRACTERLSSERATLATLQDLALGGEAYGPLVEREEPADCPRLVASDPAPVAAASVAPAIPGIRPLAVDGVAPVPERIRDSAYLLTRPLLLVARAPPQGPLKAFMDFMVSPEGQAAVARAGFVAARSHRPGVAGLAVRTGPPYDLRAGGMDRRQVRFDRR